MSFSSCIFLREALVIPLVFSGLKDFPSPLEMPMQVKAK